MSTVDFFFMSDCEEHVRAPRSGDHPEFCDKVINEVVSMDNEMIVIGETETTHFPLFKFPHF